MKKGVFIFLALSLLFSCGEDSGKKNTSEGKEVNLCRCLTEPGNTHWAKTMGKNFFYGLAIMI